MRDAEACGEIECHMISVTLIGVKLNYEFIKGKFNTVRRATVVALRKNHIKWSDPKAGVPPPPLDQNYHFRIQDEKNI